MDLPVGPQLRQEDLGDDGLQADGKLRAHLVLHVDGKSAHDAVDRLGGARRVERPEDEVARLGGGDGRADRLQVAHLADEDHVRVLPERAADRLGEGRHVAADLALRDERLLRRVVELDRVLDRDDVDAALLVDDIDHRGERRRLARARRARHEDEAARLEEKLLDGGRQTDLLQREERRGDHPENAAPAPALLEDGDAEARAVLVREGKVGAAVALGLGDLLGRHDLVAQPPRLLGRERLVRDRHQLAVDAQLRRHERAHMQVGRAFVDRRLQQVPHRDFRCHLDSSSLE